MPDSLERIYRAVPQVECKGLCSRTCGPIDMSREEWSRIARRGVIIPPPIIGLNIVESGQDYRCPALDENHRCSVYEDRPLICFLPGTWIYTSNGPKRIENVLAGEQVYGDDGLLHRVTATNSHVYCGDVVDVRPTGTHLPAWCTVDHQWLTVLQRDKRKTPKPFWSRADSLIPKRHNQEGSYLCYPRRFEGRPDLAELDVSEFVSARLDGDYLVPISGGRPIRERTQAVPSRIEVTDELLFLLGIFLAEGSASSSGAQFTMHPVEKPILERIERYLGSLGIRTTLRVGRSSTLSVHSALFGRLMRDLCGVSGYGRDAGKQLNPRLFGLLSHDQLWQIYQAWDVGDGRRSARRIGEMSTTTRSEYLAVQMGFVALANGLFPRIYEFWQSGDRRCFDVHLFATNWRDCKPGHGTKNMVDDRYVYTPVAGADQYQERPGPRHYEGPVIDLQVDGSECFVTSSGIAHNCRLWGAVESMPCPHGCEVTPGLLMDAGAQSLIGRSLRLEVTE